MIRWLHTFADQVRALPEADHLVAVQRTDRALGSAATEPLLVEIQRRGLDD